MSEVVVKLQNVVAAAPLRTVDGLCRSSVEVMACLQIHHGTSGMIQQLLLFFQK
jgi:hypothetical protein